MTDLLLPLDDPRCTEPARAGAKAAALARLVRAGFDVPDGVVLTTGAYRAAGPAAGGAGQLPDAVERAVIATAARLGDAGLAVRSSSPVEDQLAQSSAGRFATVLDVRGAEALAAAVRRVWRSARPAPSLMAVLVQRLVDADAAGVAFTADPVTGDHSTTVVEAVAGRGEPAVSGRVTPQRWRVDCDGTARREDAGGTPVLDPETAVRVATLARAVAAHTGSPQDVEWALAAGRLWLLQARPITVLPARAPARAAGTPVQVPDGYWQREAAHAPEPRSPLFRSIWYPMINRAFRFAFQECGALLDGVEFREIGGWEYAHPVPPGGRDRRPPPPWLLGLLARLAPPLRRRGRRAARFLARARAGAHADEWHHRWRPELAAGIDRLRGVALAGLPDQRLAGHLDETVAFLERATEVHFRLLPRIAVATYELVVTGRELLGWDDEQAIAPLSGRSPASTEPARELASLAERAAGIAGLRTILVHPGPDPVDRIRAIAPGFAETFDAYLRDYGFRALRYDCAAPTLAERPELLLGLIRDRLAGSADPGRPAAAAGGESELVHRLPPPARARLTAALDRAWRLHPLREESEYYTLSAPIALVRRAALAIGARLAARGQVDAADRVFLLEAGEVRSALADGRDQQAVVARRVSEQAWVRAHPGPARYGGPPPPPPSLVRVPEPLRVVNEALRWYVERTHAPARAGRSRADGAGRLDGIGASPGCYTGPARLVSGEDALATIRPGDVVVCPTMSPVWSVVFPLLGAVVTDAGGILSHPAIVAREHGVPAVVATGNATEVVADGQVVTVDGNAGVVELRPFA